MSELKVVSMKGRDIMLESDITSRFNKIYDSTNKPVLAFITARCGNNSDIGDIFQETYMELYNLMSKRGAEYVTDGKALVFRIAKRKIARHYTLLKKLQIFVSMTVKNNDGETEEIEISDAEIDSFLGEENLEDYIVNQDMLDRVRQFIKRKSPEVEQIFYFFYEAELSISEIAQALSLTESSVKNKLYRTLKELQNLLNERRQEQ
jgi:RNA polymerase sigma-70 factor (ECF subfamily)